MNDSTYKLENGDYVKRDDTEDFQSVAFVDRLEQCMKTALQTQRGRFYPDKNFGSHIRSAVRSENAERVLAYARQTAECFDGVYVKEAVLENKKATVILIINGDERSVSIDFEADL